jgi:ADP-ribose pyrophosphatase YjhB (NUDIX family)/predicted transcriptional regulator
MLSKSIKELHQVQSNILLLLASKPKSSFTELNQGKLPTDWFSFHLRQLIKNGFVEKLADKKYILTTLGKKLSLQIEAEGSIFGTSQRISILLVVKKDNKYLVQYREVEPFRKYWEFPTKRVAFGESPFDAAQKLLTDETGLKGEFNFIGLLHKVEKSGESEIFDDKYYLVFTTDRVSGELIEECNQGKNYWLTENEFRKKELLHFDLESTFALLSKGKSNLEEVVGKIIDY